MKVPPRFLLIYPTLSNANICPTKRLPSWRVAFMRYSICRLYKWCEVVRDSLLVTYEALL